MMRSDRSARSVAGLGNEQGARVGVKNSVVPIGYVGAASPLEVTS